MKTTGPPIASASWDAAITLMDLTVLDRAGLTPTLEAP